MELEVKTDPKIPKIKNGKRWWGEHGKVFWGEHGYLEKWGVEYESREEFEAAFEMFFEKIYRELLYSGKKPW